MVDDLIFGVVRRWLAPIGATVAPVVPAMQEGCPVLGWAASGAMTLTGDPDGPPADSPAMIWPLLEAVAAWTGKAAGWAGDSVAIDPRVLLGGRAALLDLSRAGQVSAGGGTRLLRCSDGWAAVTLSRDDDVDLVPAMLGRGHLSDHWAGLRAFAASRPRVGFAQHVRLFGVPAAPLPTHTISKAVPWRITRIAAARSAHRCDGALVVDLSSLWAGPVCARVLADAGARVVKVESTHRPDGARSGNREFYDWLHAGHASVALDFTSPRGRQQLAELINNADVVIEASRPRALRQLGVAFDQVRHRPGRVWVSITGYGRAEADLVAFGDDAAVAGGLVGWIDERPVFCADAVADPLTGLCAALGVVASMAEGGGHLIDVSMRDVAAAFAGSPAPDHGTHDVYRAGSGWAVHCPEDGAEQAVLPPRAPAPVGVAAPLGADTDLVLTALANGQRW